MSISRSTVLSSVAAAALALGVVGCAPEQQNLVPGDAQKMSSAVGMTHFVAPTDGTVFVMDGATRLVGRYSVSKNQSVDVDPAKNVILVNSAPAASNVLAADHRYDLYFEPSATPANADIPAPQPQPQPQPQPPVQPSSSNSNGQPYNGAVTVTPSVIVQPSTDSNTPNGSVTVQPGLNVTTQPSPQISR